MTARKKGKTAEAGGQMAAFQTPNNSGNDTRFDRLIKAKTKANELEVAADPAGGVS